MKKIVFTMALGVFATVSATDEVVVDTGNNNEVEAVTESNHEGKEKTLHGPFLSIGLGGRFRKNSGWYTDKNKQRQTVKDQDVNQVEGIVGVGYNHTFSNNILVGIEGTLSFSAKKSNSVTIEGVEGKVTNSGFEQEVKGRVGVQPSAGSYCVYVGSGVRHHSLSERDEEIHKLSVLYLIGLEKKLSDRYAARLEANYTGGGKEGSGNSEAKFGKGWGVRVTVTAQAL